jgi:hypothetical protein
MTSDRIRDPVATWRRPLTVVCVVVCVLASVVLFIGNLRLIAMPWPLDYDGFYYLTEIRSYQETSRGHYFPFQPFFAFLNIFVTTFSLSAPHAFHTSVVVTLAVFGLAVSLLALDVKRPHRAALLLVCVCASQSLFFTHYGFLKQAAGITAFVAMLAALHALANVRSTVVITVIIVALGLFAASFHKFSALLTVATLACATALPRPARAIGAVLAGAALCFLFATAAPDISQLSWRSSPATTAFSRGQINAFEQLELVLHVLLVVIMVGYATWTRRAEPRLLVACALFCLLRAPLWGAENWRMERSSFWVAFIAMAFFLRVDFRAASQDTIKNVLASAFALVVVVATVALPRTPHVLGPGMPVESIAHAAPLMSAWIPAGAVVHAPHGVQFRVTYFWRLPAARTPPAGSTEGFTVGCVERGRACPRVADVQASDVPSLTCVRLDDAWQVSRGPWRGRQLPRSCPAINAQPPPHPTAPNPP